MLKKLPSETERLDCSLSCMESERSVSHCAMNNLTAVCGGRQSGSYWCVLCVLCSVTVTMGAKV